MKCSFDKKCMQLCQYLEYAVSFVYNKEAIMSPVLGRPDEYICLCFIDEKDGCNFGEEQEKKTLR